MNIKLKYYLKVGIPLWFTEAKTLLFVIGTTILFLCVAVPIGFIIDLKEKREANKLAKNIKMKGETWGV